MKRYVISLISAGLWLVSVNSYAAENTGYRIIIDGAAVGASFGCSSNQIRWDANTSAMGQSHLSMMLATMKSSGTASFNISGCYTHSLVDDGSTPWPTFIWAHYKNYLSYISALNKKIKLNAC